MTMEQAQALLAINAAEAKQKDGPKLPMGLIVTVLVLVALVFVASSLIGGMSKKPASKSPSSTGAASSSNTSPSGATSDQINHDVQSCSNPTTALSEC